MILPTNKGYPAPASLDDEKRENTRNINTKTGTKQQQALLKASMDKNSAAAVDLRRVYTMPARGDGGSDVSNNNHESNNDDEEGMSMGASASQSRVVLRHSKSEGDAEDSYKNQHHAVLSSPDAQAHSLLQKKQQEGTPSTTTKTSPSTSGNSSHSPKGSKPQDGVSAQQNKRTRHKVDRFGFILNMDSNGKIHYSESSDDGSDDSPDVPTSSEVERAERRLAKWQGMLLRGDASSRRKRKNFLKFLPSAPPSSSFSFSSLMPISSLTLSMTPTQFFAQQSSQNEQHRHYHRHSARPKQHSKKLVRRARKGIPDSIRGRVWSNLLADVLHRMDQHEGLYDRLVRETIVDDDDDTDNGLLNTPPTSATQQTRDENDPESSKSPSTTINLTKSFRNLQDTIERDIHRTFPRHEMFCHYIEEEENEDDDDDDDIGPAVADLCGSAEISNMIREMQLSQRPTNSNNSNNSNNIKNVMDAKGGQASLRRVLKAYSLYDREIGYCQGMNFIAGMLITQVSEEEAFWLLVSVMFEEPCRMRGLFGEGMRETHQVLYVAEKLIFQFLPKLAQHLEREHVHITMFATQWLLTQYTSSFKFDLVLRVWDCFLTEGWKITYRVMLALLQEWQSDLLKMSFEEILAFFRELPNRAKGGHIVDAANKIPLRRKHIAKYENEWIAQQPKE